MPYKMLNPSRIDGAVELARIECHPLAPFYQEVTALAHSLAAIIENSIDTLWIDYIHGKRSAKQIMSAARAARYALNPAIEHCALGRYRHMAEAVRALARPAILARPLHRYSDDGTPEISNSFLYALIAANAALDGLHELHRFMDTVTAKMEARFSFLNHVDNKAFDSWVINNPVLWNELDEKKRAPTWHELHEYSPKIAAEAISQMGILAAHMAYEAEAREAGAHFLGAARGALMLSMGADYLPKEQHKAMFNSWFPAMLRALPPVRVQAAFGIPKAALAAAIAENDDLKTFKRDTEERREKRRIINRNNAIKGSANAATQAIEVLETYTKLSRMIEKRDVAATTAKRHGVSPQYVRQIVRDANKKRS